MKNKKGFTLIELLAVIVILAIIALIAVPVILNVIDKANKSAFKDTAYGLISAGELYFAEQQLDLNGMEKDVTFTFPTDEIDIKGNVPDGTKLRINTNGDISLAMSNERYCVTKGYSSNDITLTEKDTESECDLPTPTLADLVVVSSELGVDKVDSCIAKERTCAPGTAFAIKVNADEVYKFYVIDDNIKLAERKTTKLIMASNLEAQPGLGVSSDKYVWDNASTTGPWNVDGDKTQAPLSVLATLKHRTQNWDYIAKIDDTQKHVEDSYNGYETYTGEYLDETRAQLLRDTDLKHIGWPEWLGEGTSKNLGYWTANTVPGKNQAYAVRNDNGIKITGLDVAEARYVGLRPVIIIDKY